MGNRLMVLILMVAVVVLTACGGGDGEPDGPSQELLLEVASEINKGGPMMVDRETELVNVGAEPSAIVYNYRLVNLTAADITAEEIQALKPTVVNSACSQPKTRQDFLDQGIAMKYSYSAKDMVFLTEFTVEPSDCSA
ncbi:MAG: hypothetical protein AAF604_06260 [Acidobacteriota bacterium]